MRVGLTIALTSFVLLGCSDEYSTLRGQFIAGCLQGGAPKDICACTFEGLEKQYTPQEFRKLTATGQTPPESFLRNVVHSAQQCQ